MRDIGSRATHQHPTFSSTLPAEEFALGKPVMMPRAEGEVGTATFPKWWLLLLGRWYSGGSEVLPVLLHPSLCHLISSLASSESQVTHDKGNQSRRNDGGP